MYRNKLESIKENLRIAYDNNLRMFNTNILMYIIKTNLSSMVFSGKEFIITNSKGDKLSLYYKDNTDVIKLSIDNGEYIDITNLVMSKNKYGSAIIKRFFKNYYNDIYDTIIESRMLLAKLYYNDLKNHKGKVVITNIYEDKLKYHNGSFMLETKDRGNITVIQKMEEDDIIKFLVFCNEINYVKLD